MPLSRMEQLLAFIDWERKNSPPTNKQHIVEWAYEELVRLYESKEQIMPFKSEAQRKFMYANHPKLAKEFESKTPKDKKLPKKVAKKSGGKK